jgi:hypothetical protein
VSRLAFLSADGVPLVSPLRHALAADDAGVVTDVSALGKLEVRGDLDRLEAAPGEELIRITPARGLLVCDGSRAAARDRLAADGFRVYDLTSALAGLEVEGEDLLRRLTELDLDALPAVGAIARGTPAVIERRGGERFRLFVPQELGHYVAEVVLDLAQGLAR